MPCLETRITTWNNDISLNTSSWTTVWELPTEFPNGWFFQSVWQLNSNSVWFRFEQNNCVVVELELSNVADDYYLSFKKHSAPIVFPLVEFESLRWQFNPAISPRSSVSNEDVGFRISMKASSYKPTKRVLCGLTVWGPQ